MGNLGATEILLILLVVLLLFGAKRIPEIARGLGKGIREFKDATNDIKREISLSDPPPPPQIPPSHGQPYPHAPGTYAAPPAPPHALPAAPPANVPPAIPPTPPVADEPPPAA